MSRRAAVDLSVRGLTEQDVDRLDPILQSNDVFDFPNGLESIAVFGVEGDEYNATQEGEIIGGMPARDVATELARLVREALGRDVPTRVVVTEIEYAPTHAFTFAEAQQDWRNLGSQHFD